MPPDGAVLILCNHQSSIDPVLVGISFDRRLDYMAKKSLFDNKVFGFLIRALDAIPIDRDKGGLAGLRAMLERLKAGRAVLIFPEGTRSKNGELLPIKGGFIPVAKRSKATLLPMAFVGANEVIESGKLFPQRRTVVAVVGKPIQAADYCELSDEGIIELASLAISRCHEKASALRSVAVR